MKETAVERIGLVSSERRQETFHWWITLVEVACGKPLTLPITIDTSSAIILNVPMRTPRKDGPSQRLRYECTILRVDGAHRCYINTTAKKLINGAPYRIRHNPDERP